ncbi:MAG: condensation domain-containing protein, partial [Burkholderiaceae bacterium]
MIRGRLLRVSAQEHVLLITQHPIISDSGSMRVLIRELAALYGAFAAGKGDPLPPLELQYADYARWQRQHLPAELLEEQQKFWTQNLSGIPALMQLPTDRPRRATQFYSSDQVHLKLSTTLTQRLMTLARQQRVSLFTTLLSAWATLLGRWSGQDEVVIGSRVSHRGRPEFEPLIGPFENTMAVRIALQEDATVEQLLKQAKSTLAQAHAHRDVPFEQVVAALDPARRQSDRSQGPMLQVLMELNDTPAGVLGAAELRLPQLKLDEVSLRNATTPFELSLSLNEVKGHLCGTLDYASELFDRETIERMAACWEVLLKGMVKHVRRPISRVSMLTAAERERVLYGFNETAVAYPREKLIHE